MKQDLSREFESLSHQLRQVISLLEESGDAFWIAFLRRGLRQVDERRLAGATFVLGCYGGEDTFSDVVIGKHWQESKPLEFKNANARLQVLRDGIFESAGAIASRRHW